MQTPFKLKPLTVVSGLLVLSVLLLVVLYPTGIFRFSYIAFSVRNYSGSKVHVSIVGTRVADGSKRILDTALGLGRSTPAYRIPLRDGGYTQILCDWDESEVQFTEIAVQTESGDCFQITPDEPGPHYTIGRISELKPATDPIRKVMSKPDLSRPWRLPPWLFVTIVLLDIPLLGIWLVLLGKVIMREMSKPDPP